MNKYTVRVYFLDSRINRWRLRTTAATAERALQKAVNYREPPERWAVMMAGDHPVMPDGNPAEIPAADIGRYAPLTHRGVRISQAARVELDAYYERKGGRNVGVRLSPKEQSFLAEYGSGSMSAGIRRLIADKQNENTSPPSLSDLV